MKSDELEFRADGPFDEEERETIRELHAALGAVEGSDQLVSNVRRNLALLEELGAVVRGYPSLFEKQSLGRRRRDLSSLLDMLSRSNLANFEMFLPTRALVGRTLIMAEMNFYRLLRFVCEDALDEVRGAELLGKVDRHVCHCIYTRLAGELLTNIASDDRTARKERKKAVMMLLHIWERVTFRLGDLLPVLQATWEARRRVVVIGGTLFGATEIFQLLQAGCDERFVGLLVRPEHTADEAEAFREFLFGATTEQLISLEQALRATGEVSTSITDLSSLSRHVGAQDNGADPALAMFEFFLSRHLQASARRQANLPGPKRTAEEYVVRHYLETVAPEALVKALRGTGA